MTKVTTLYKKTVVPVFIMIIIIVGVFSAVSSFIIIVIQNNHTMKMLDQSMEYAYTNVTHQVNNINSFLSLMLNNREIENILEKKDSSIEENVNDYMTINANLEKISLMSLVTDIGDGEERKVSYIISIIVEKDSSLYNMASSQYSAVSGVYKKEAVSSEHWYKTLFKEKYKPVWWIEESNGFKLICNAQRQTSIKDGRDIGIIVVAYDINNLKNILGKPVMNKSGHYVLMDEYKRVIYSPNYDMFYSMQNEEYIKNISGSSGTFITRLKNERTIVKYNSLRNKWIISAVVEEKSIRSYTYLIAITGFLISILCISISGYIIRRQANGISVPVGRLVEAMKRLENGDFEYRVEGSTFINEVDELYKGYNEMAHKIDGLIKDVYIKDIERKHSELQMLQSQINPHFLYNTLNIINCQAITKGAEDISFTVKALANVFRYGLNRGLDFITLREEIKQVSSYLDIQKLMNKELKVEIMVDEEINDERVINLIIQPFVENSIIHGFKDKTNNCIIRINAKKIKEDILIEIWDNGIGIEHEAMNIIANSKSKENPKGYGIINVNRRIKLHFGDNYGIVYRKIEAGTCVVIKLPLSKII